MKKILIISLLFFGISKLIAQDFETKKQAFPIHISVLKESLSIPVISNPFEYKYNPGLIIGTEYLLKKKNNHDFHLSGNLGYYYHRNWESTFFSDVRLGYRYYIKRFSISPDIGFGYGHIFSAKSVYGFTDGKFQEVTDKGRSVFQSSISITPSFKLSDKEDATEVYFTYNFIFQYPFSVISGFHQFVGVGCKFYPFKNI